MGEPVPHGYQDSHVDSLSQEGTGLETEPASHRESYGTDVPFAEHPTSISKLTPFPTPLNSEHEKKSDQGSSQDSLVKNTKESEANQKDVNQDLNHSEATKTTISITPSESELEKKTNLESGPGTFAINSNEAEANPKEQTNDSEADTDPNIIGWDGPDDPKNPTNWPERAKWGNVMVISMITFIT